MEEIVNATNHFIEDIIEEDIAAGLTERIHTRFPPEPNGYLHIGSAKAIWINHSISKKYGGLFNLRYDDTNPVKEGDEYVRSIWEDITWLTGEEPSGGVFYGSDYFEKCYEYALHLIREGKAYVDDLTQEQMREYRGTLTQPGRESPCRNRPVEENLELFTRMEKGEFADGSLTLRAKIDMASPNINMRDPVIYRILHTDHHRQGSRWCIYPMYDFAHPIQDALEGITHSLCSIEFENHRPLYDWVVDNLPLPHRPKQREFARLNVTNTVMSKRYLRQLVETGLVDGWDDPRMPTLCGLRRRGYTPSAILEFVRRAGVAKTYSVVDSGLLEHCIRDELNKTACRRMAVTDPIKVTLTNYPEDKQDLVEVANNPEDETAGTRTLTFSRELYIERADFAEVPPPKYQRLKPEGEVRLMGAYIIKCNEFIKDAEGKVTELLCTVDFDTLGCNPPDGRKVRGAIHWVDARNCVEAELCLYDALFTIANVDDMEEGKTYDDYLNTDSRTVMAGAKLEASLRDACPGERFQFVRQGYFCRDSKNDGTFNRIVSLKDSWAKISAKG